MCWRIHNQIVRGELDNRTPGKVTGWIWLEGREAPVRIDLEGNPWRDWAGCVLRFANPSPRPGALEGFADVQTGVCGDLTASRRRRTPACAPGKPSRLGNRLYLEWHSASNGRVVIETGSFALQLSPAAWVMRAEEEAELRQKNLQRLTDFLDRLETPPALPENDDFSDDADSLDESESSDLGLVPDAEEEAADRALKRMLEIEELKQKARELSGGEMAEETPGREPVPLDVQEQFWRQVVSFESAPLRKRREVLAEEGIIPPSPANLSDDELYDELWRLIRNLADQRIYLSFTNHLSDRELYSLLVERVLEEETEALPPELGWNSHISVDEYGTSDEDDGVMIFLRYYADDATRESWEDEFGEELPPRLDPPYARDHLLPSVDGEVSDDSDPWSNE